MDHSMLFNVLYSITIIGLSSVFGPDQRSALSTALSSFIQFYITLALQQLITIMISCYYSNNMFVRTSSHQNDISFHGQRQLIKLLLL